MHFASFFSGGFITAIIVNPPERRMAIRTSVQKLNSYDTTDLYCISFQHNFRGIPKFRGFQISDTRVSIFLLRILGAHQNSGVFKFQILGVIYFFQQNFRGIQKFRGFKIIGKYYVECTPIFFQ